MRIKPGSIVWRKIVLGKVIAHASLSAAAIMIGTSPRKGSVGKAVIQRIR